MLAQTMPTLAKSCELLARDFPMIAIEDFGPVIEKRHKVRALYGAIFTCTMEFSDLIATLDPMTAALKQVQEDVETLTEGGKRFPIKTHGSSSI